MVENLSGIEVCRRLRRMPETSNVPIIMLTARGEEEDRVRGLETGADDYVTKPFLPRELIARVNAVLRRVRPALAGEVLVFGDLEMDTTSTSARRGGEVIPARLHRSSTCRGTCWSTPAQPFAILAARHSVWGQDSDIELRTVDVHIRRLLQAIEYRRPAGY